MNTALAHKILLIEDNPGDADLTSERLADVAPGRCDLRCVATLKAAISLLPTFAADAIILDLNLPDSRGVDTLKQIKPLAGSAAIIVLSGLVDDNLRARALRDGAEEVFAKNEASSRLFARSILYVIERNIERHSSLERQRELERLLDANPDAILVVSPTATVRYVNRAALALFESSRDALVGATLGFAIDGAEQSEVTIHRSDGERICELRAVPLEWEGDRATLTAIHDITERKHAEELRQRSAVLELESRQAQEASRLKSEFLSTMSHELRTPLNAIIGFSELLADGNLPPFSQKHTTYVGYILTSARHLLRLINDVLDLAKVEAGKLELFPETISLEAVVHDVINVLGNIASQKSIEVTIDLGPGIGDLFLDPVRLRQVLFNYVSNALKFTPQNGRVVLRTRTAEGAMFRLEVEDTGPGISAENLERLFVEFEQLDGGTASGQQGTGLGLALTKRLVQAQGGSVGVTSTVGVGTTFFAILPQRTPAPDILNAKTD